MPLTPAGGQSTIYEFPSAIVTFQCFIFSIGNKVMIGRSSSEEEK